MQIERQLSWRSFLSKKITGHRLTLLISDSDSSIFFPHLEKNELTVLLSAARWPKEITEVAKKTTK